LRKAVSMKKTFRRTPEELAKFSPHAVAELLANIVMILRRMPDVPISDLVSRPAAEVSGMVARLRKENTNGEQVHELPDWAE